MAYQTATRRDSGPAGISPTALRTRATVRFVGGVEYSSINTRSAFPPPSRAATSVGTSPHHKTNAAAAKHRIRGFRVRPYATIRHARDTVCELREAQPERDVLVLIRGGTFRSRPIHPCLYSVQERREWTAQASILIVS